MRLPSIPLGLLALGLALTAVAAGYARSMTEAREKLRFDNATVRVRAAIEGRIDAYVAMLLGGAGLFAASEGVDEGEFKAYVERLDVSGRYPGVQGIGFSAVIHPTEREVIARRIRTFHPSFAYRPKGHRQVQHAILYLEPLDERNRIALGYDMYTEEHRREAMDRARDDAAPAATRRVRLVQEITPEDQQAGFLIYVPVYAGGEVPGSLDSRRAKLEGFVYSPFRAADLLGGISDRYSAREVRFDVLDWPADGVPALLHRGPDDGVRSRYVTEVAMPVAGHRWIIRMRSGTDFARPSGWIAAGGVGALGSLLSLAVFAVSRTQLRARQAAERIADDLRRSEEAQREANRTKDEFLAVVSHELRTPLNAIVGWVSMLRRHKLPPEAREHALEIIERNAVAQTRLIEDLLDVSRAVGGGLSLQLADMDVGATLRAAVESVNPAAAKSGLSLDCELESGLGTIRGDQERVQQVVLNVLSNSIKFTPPGGQVRVSAARTEEAIVIRVTDTGVGISAGFLPHAFEQFRQADTSTTRAYNGIGVGLAIARHIVERHGGRIEISSQGEGAGTTCTITLPAAQEFARA